MQANRCPTRLRRRRGDALRADQSRQVEEGDQTFFVHVHNPPARMVIVGAVHITQALAGMAEAAGYDVIVCDPRRAFADDARFPAVEVSIEWPDDVLNRLVPDHRTAVVTLTHDPKIDDPALEVAVRAPVFYIGALGSRRTHGKRLERLREKGFFRGRAWPHPRPHRARHRRPFPGRDRGLDHGGGDAGAPCAARRRQQVIVAP